MIRSLNLMDTSRVATIKATDIVATPDNPDGRSLPRFNIPGFFWERMRYRHKSACFVWVENGRMDGVLSLRPRNGSTSWFVDHLAMCRIDHNAMTTLLEAAGGYAGEAGAERLFLRLPEEWRVQKPAIQCGFISSMKMMVLTLPGRSALLGTEDLPNFRRTLPVDDYELFRLYTACTPPEVRFKTGLTFQQWEDSREPKTKRTQELVLDGKDRSLSGALRIDPYRNGLRVRLTVHPNSDIDMQAMVAYVLSFSRGKAVWWEVAEHQWGLYLMLQHVGFKANSSYMVMIKSLALLSKESTWVAAPTSG